MIVSFEFVFSESFYSFIMKCFSQSTFDHFSMLEICCLITKAYYISVGKVLFYWYILPVCFQQLMPKVVELNLSNNKLPGIQHLQWLSHMVHLDLSYNCIEQLEKLHSKLGNLKTLNLAGNKLKDLQGLSWVMQSKLYQETTLGTYKMWLLHSWEKEVAALNKSCNVYVVAWASWTVFWSSKFDFIL